MLSKTDIITVEFKEYEHDAVRAMAEQCWLGSDDGSVATHGTQQLDSSQYKADQVTGQYGELALHKLFYDNDDDSGLHYYLKQREIRNANKYEGDSGSDLWAEEDLGFKLDSKTSTMRRSKNPLDYNLIVRPRDLHDNTVYILMLKPTQEDIIHAVGYLWTNELPKTIKTSGPFDGAYVKSARFLNSLKELFS